MKRKTQALLMMLVMLSAVLFFGGCQNNPKTEEDVSVNLKTGETNYPVAFTDDLGMEVSIEKMPEKIVSLSPATTEIVFALGQESKLVGRTDYCNYPKAVEAVPSIGDFNDPNVEKIISMTPDIVLASDFISPEIRTQIEAIGAKVILYCPVSIDGVMKNIIDTAEVLNANDQANTLVNKMEVERQGIIEKAKTVQTQKSVFIDVGEFFSAGPGSMLDSMLNEVNAVNVTADTGKQWPQLTTEQIIAANPDIYISLFATPEEIKAVSGFDKIKAIQNNEIPYYAFLAPEADLLQRPGPRIVEGLAMLEENVYPELFKK